MRKKKSTTLVGFWTASWEDVAKACGFSQDTRGYQNIRVATRGSLIVVVPPMLAEARGTPYKDGKLWQIVITYHVATIPCIWDARLTLPAGYPEFWDANAWFELPSYGLPLLEFMKKLQEHLGGGANHLPADLASVKSVLAWQLSPGELGAPRPDARVPPPLPAPSGRELLKKLELAREKERSKAVTAIWRLVEPSPASPPAPMPPQEEEQQQPSQLNRTPSRSITAPPAITPENPDYSSSDDDDEQSDFWKFEEFVISSDVYQGKSYHDMPFYPGRGNWKVRCGYYTWKRLHPKPFGM